MKNETCGQSGGVTARGTPCGRPAGWGTDENEGRCREHIGQRVLQVLPRSEPFEPDSLHPEAKTIWDLYKDHLEPRERAGLKLMCMLLHRALKNFTHLEREGDLLPDPVHGENLKKNPAWQMFRDAQAQYRSWSEHFEGRLERNREKSPMERLLEGS